MSTKRRIKLAIICIGFFLIVLYFLVPYITVVSKIHLDGIICHSGEIGCINLGYWKTGSLIEYEAKFSANTFCGIAPSILLSVMPLTSWNSDVNTRNFMLQCDCCTQVSTDMVLEFSDFYFFIIIRLQLNVSLSYQVIFRFFVKPLEESRLPLLSTGGSMVCSAFLSFISDENGFRNLPRKPRPDYVV
jgi:hypothetical protein